jgi:hypothetical protein
VDSQYLRLTNYLRREEEREFLDLDYRKRESEKVIVLSKNPVLGNSNGTFLELAVIEIEIS